MIAALDGYQKCSEPFQAIGLPFFPLRECSVIPEHIALAWIKSSATGTSANDSALTHRRGVAWPAGSAPALVAVVQENSLYPSHWPLVALRHLEVFVSILQFSKPINMGSSLQSNLIQRDKGNRGQLILLTWAVGVATAKARSRGGGELSSGR